MVNSNDLHYGDVIVVRLASGETETGTVRAVSMMQDQPIVDYTIGQHRDKWAKISQVMSHLRAD